jgi:hypothetical protein
VSRLLNPLTGSNTWVQYDGTTVVRKVWNGRCVQGRPAARREKLIAAGALPYDLIGEALAGARLVL